LVDAARFWQSPTCCQSSCCQSPPKRWRLRREAQPWRTQQLLQRKLPQRQAGSGARGWAQAALPALRPEQSQQRTALQRESGFVLD